MSALPPGRLALGIGLIVVGVASGAVLLVLSLRSAFASLLRVPSGTSQELRLERGDYTVYWEVPGTGARLNAPEVAVTVRSSAGQDIAFTRSGAMVSRYSTFERRGVSVGSISIVEPGPYTVTAKGPQGGAIALTQSLGFFGTLKLVLIPLALICGGVISGVVLLSRKTPPP